jgi:hypothetical protein
LIAVKRLCGLRPEGKLEFGREEMVLFGEIIEEARKKGLYEYPE